MDLVTVSTGVEVFAGVDGVVRGADITAAVFLVDIAVVVRGAGITVAITADTIVATGAGVVAILGACRSITSPHLLRTITIITTALRRLFTIIHHQLSTVHPLLH